MKSRTLIIAAVVLPAFVGLGASPAHATGYTSNVSGGSGPWGTDTNWTPTGVPGADDTAEILAGDTIHVTDTQSVWNLTIQAHASSPGTLDMRDGGKLTIKNALDLKTDLAEPGRIVASSSADSCTQPTLVFETSTTAAGEITVTGTCGLTIEGTDCDVVLSITGTVSASGGPLTLSVAFENDGEIVVNGDYVLLIDTCGPEAGSSGEFKVNSSSGTMRFDSGAGATITSKADFTVASGTLYLYAASLETNGGLKQTGGVIQVDPTYTFKVTGPWDLND